MLELKYNDKFLAIVASTLSREDLIQEIFKRVQHTDFYLLHNGKLLQEGISICKGVVHAVPQLVGGKGGFGSMLRAIGAQIEKTTNREACRDLSGRRLRDINEEKRLKAWIDKQPAREQEAEDRKQKKLERLLQPPKHEYKDEVYDKQRSELPERIEEAVAQGMEAAASASSSDRKRKSEGTSEAIKKKKKKTLWIEDGLDISSCDEISDSDSEGTEERTQGK